MPGMGSLFKQINLSKLEVLFPKRHTGRPRDYDRTSFILALLLRTLKGISSYKDLENYLTKHDFWARRCGFHDKVPDQSYYCKFLKSLDIETLSLINHFLIEELKRVGILTRDWVIDSSPLEALSYDNEGKWGYCPTKEEYVFGYRIHMIACAHSELPIRAIVTPCNESEFNQAVPLINETMWDPVLMKRTWIPRYVIADKGYDSREIRRNIQALNAKDIIPQRETTGLRINYSKKWKKKYRLRTSVERCFSRIKDFLPIKTLGICGLEKITKLVNLAIMGILAMALWAVYNNMTHRIRETKELLRMCF